MFIQVIPTSTETEWVTKIVSLLLFFLNEWMDAVFFFQMAFLHFLSQSYNFSPFFSYVVNSIDGFLNVKLPLLGLNILGHAHSF